MLYTLIKFLSFSPENVTKEVYWALAVIYALLLLTTLASISSVHRSMLSRVAWCLLAVFVPVLGIAAHCIYCLVTADYTFIKQFGFVSANAKAQSALNNKSIFADKSFAKLPK